MAVCFWNTRCSGNGAGCRSELFMSDPVTIALHTARKRRDEGGALSPVDMPHVRTPKFHNGAIHSGVAGRTDHLPITVESGSYVVPADIVSAGGAGNTLAGFKVLRR